MGEGETEQARTEEENTEDRIMGGGQGGNILLEILLGDVMGEEVRENRRGKCSRSTTTEECLQVIK